MTAISTSRFVLGLELRFACRLKLPFDSTDILLFDRSCLGLDMPLAYTSVLLHEVLKTYPLSLGREEFLSKTPDFCLAHLADSLLGGGCRRSRNKALFHQAVWKNVSYRRYREALGGAKLTACSVSELKNGEGPALLIQVRVFDGRPRSSG